MTLVHPSITWTDTIGAATLTSVPLTFMNWTPDVDEIGDSQVPIGDRQTFFFAYRTDNIVSFEIAQIPLEDRALALRLKSHLVTGGSAVIHTEDTEAHTYTVNIAPGTIPDFQMTDLVQRSYTLKLVVVNTETAILIYTPVVVLRGATLTLEPGPLVFHEGDAPTTVTATLLDRDSNPIVGFTINGVSNNESSFTISPSSDVTDSSGQVVYTVTPHLAGVGNVHAVAGALIASVAVTVLADCPVIWDETFDQTDVDAFVAQYNTNDAIGWDPDDITNGLLVLSGGTMRAYDGASADINFGPDAFAPVRECWYRALFNISGADLNLGGARPIAFWLWGDDTVFACFNSVNANAAPFVVDEVWQLRAEGSPPTDVDSSTSVHMPIGDYAFYLCVSEPTPGALKSELWINPTPGDAPLVTATTARDGSGTVSRITQVLATPSHPPDSGTTHAIEGPAIISLTQCTLMGCGRASDPFGIL